MAKHGLIYKSISGKGKEKITRFDIDESSGTGYNNNKNNNNIYFLIDDSINFDGPHRQKV